MLVISVSPEMQVNIWDKITPTSNPKPRPQILTCISGETDISDLLITVIVL